MVVAGTLAVLFFTVIFAASLVYTSQFPFFCLEGLLLLFRFAGFLRFLLGLQIWIGDVLPLLYWLMSLITTCCFSYFLIAFAAFLTVLDLKKAWAYYLLSVWMPLAQVGSFWN